MESPKKPSGGPTRRGLLGGLVGFGAGAMIPKHTGISEVPRESSNSVEGPHPSSGVEANVSDWSGEAFEKETYLKFIDQFNHEHNTKLSFEGIDYKFDDLGTPVHINIRHGDLVTAIDVQPGLERGVTAGSVTISYQWFKELVQLKIVNPTRAR